MSKLATAATVANDLLMRSADAMEDSRGLLTTCLDGLAAAGLYDLTPDEPLLLERVAETLAAGCLTVAVVWMQHHGATRGVAESDNDALRSRWLHRLRTGETRSTTTFAGALPTPLLRATLEGDDYVVTGRAPWVTGWSNAHVVYLSARDDNDRIVWLLTDTDASPSVATTPVRMLAMNASDTVDAEFHRHHVPADRIVQRVTVDAWRERDAERLRVAGYLALGLARRCLQLGHGDSLVSAIDRCRDALDSATPNDAPDLRAEASHLALRAAAATLVATGSRGILHGQTTERLAREALVLLVFASRASIRDALFTRLTGRT